MRQKLNTTVIASAKNIGKNILKGLLWFLVFILGLVLLIVLALQIPAVQNFAAQKGASYLSHMLETRVEIGKFRTDWRNSLVLEDVYIEDHQQDTLWYSQRLGADIAIWDLLGGEVNVSKLDLEHATVKLHIRPDSTSNFDFLVNAFATDTTAAQPADTAAAMTFNLGVINLVDINLKFRDEAGGNYVASHVGELTTTMEELDLEAQRYMVDEVELRNTWVDFVQTKLPPETEPEPLTFNIGLNNAVLANVKVNFVSKPANQSIKL
ncbi:MAG: hypothetical protein LPK19_11155, partial [Hymenobacteraceae bacterium]|nr:hypothetical protein [Hymenobacteraceae bacterium]MDX5396790.1 hypothetical protein [Hymenobacteraceae bacterium]MDX5512853.1 hypothetical protein [Hymenobacteraceae bacterium]